jgi:hypothetical protein
MLRWVLPLRVTPKEVPMFRLAMIASAAVLLSATLGAGTSRSLAPVRGSAQDLTLPSAQLSKLFSWADGASGTSTKEYAPSAGPVAGVSESTIDYEGQGQADVRRLSGPRGLVFRHERQRRPQRFPQRRSARYDRSLDADRDHRRVADDLRRSRPDHAREGDDGNAFLEDHRCQLRCSSRQSGDAPEQIHRK